MKRIMTVVLCLAAAVFLCGGVAGADTGGARSVVIVDGAGVFNLYTGSSLEALLGSEDEVGYLGHDTLMPNVTEYEPYIRTTNFDDVKDCEVGLWYFENGRAVTKLAAWQVEYIQASAKQGAVVGIGGDDESLISAMSLQDSQSGVNPGEGVAYAFFSYALEDGVRDDYTLMLQSDGNLGRAWSLIYAWADEKISGTAVSQKSTLGSYVPEDAPLSAKYTASDDYDPWLATYNTKLIAYGQNGDIAEAISVYKLDTSSEEYDWYRVDANTQGSTQNYYYDWDYCKNYIDKLQSSFKSYTSKTGELWEYSPTTTQTNTSVSYDLGASLSGDVKKDPGAKAEISAGYSKSYDCYEVTIYDNSSLSYNKGEWRVEIEGPDWWNWWFGFGNYQPSATAQSSYVYEPSTIWRVAKDHPLELTTSATNTMSSSYTMIVYFGYDYWVEAEINNVELSVKGD